jgi:hypothetical protein
VRGNHLGPQRFHAWSDRKLRGRGENDHQNDQDHGAACDSRRRGCAQPSRSDQEKHARADTHQVKARERVPHDRAGQIGRGQLAERALGHYKAYKQSSAHPGAQ